MKNITPIIKKTRTKIEEYEICPHCQEEIREKSIYVDEENYVYHSPCTEKGPIDKIKPLTDKEFNNLFKGKPQKIAQSKYDPKELEIGIEIESEHKNLYDLFKDFCDKNNVKMPLTEKEMYEMITKVHLDELPTYNTELKKMEKKEEKKLEANFNRPYLNTGNSIYFIK